MSERFFVDTPIEGNSTTLVGAEAHHLARVLRAQVGDVITLFDGSGCEFVGRILKIGKQAVEFAVEERREIDRESAVSLTLAVALPKGDRQRWLVEKAVELGVARMIPLLTERGVAQPADAVLARLRRSVIETSKQCGRNRLMEIANPLSIGNLIRESLANSVRLLCHPGGQPLPAICPAADATDGNRVVVAAIGPEGGFAEGEVAEFRQADWQAVDLGSRILRIETAALAIAAWAALTKN